MLFCNAISIGGDTDTIACMTCSLAEAYYKEVPCFLEDIVLDYFDEIMIKTHNKFSELLKKLENK